MKDGDLIVLEALLRHFAERETPEQKEAKAKTLQEFRAKWAGRTFGCFDTGTVFTIPDDVHYRAFYTIGKGFIDVGDGYYSRWSGNIVEIEKKEEGNGAL